MQDEQQRIESHNRRVREQLIAGRESRGYMPVNLHGSKVHAAVSETKGHSGYVHPRALCQISTPTMFAAGYGDDQSRWPVVDCKRCLASLAKRAERVS